MFFCTINSVKNIPKRTKSRILLDVRKIHLQNPAFYRFSSADLRHYMGLFCPVLFFLEIMACWLLINGLLDGLLQKRIGNAAS